MPERAICKLRLSPTGRELLLERGRRLLGGIVRAGLPIGRACEGEGICGACRVVVRGGVLSEPESDEVATLSRIDARPDERLACRARLLGDAEISCAAWGPLEEGP